VTAKRSWRERLALSLLTEALRAGLLPRWVRAVRLSTWAEDQAGQDIVVTTTEGQVALQVLKDKRGGLVAWRKRHGWRGGIAVVRFGQRHVAKGDVLRLCLEALAALRTAEGPEHPQA
jgi:hypothetical protein